MSQELTESFRNAIALEQKADTLLADSYIQSYSPKKLAQLGIAIVNLVTTNVKTGLGGKTIVELELDSAVKNDNDLSVGSIRIGDIVKVSKMNNTSDIVKAKKAARSSSKKVDNDPIESNDSSADGVVIKINSNAITLTVDDDNDERAVYNDSGKLWIVKAANSITYKRMTTAMNKLDELTDKNELIQLLLGDAKYIPLKNTKSLKPRDFYNQNLNQSQQDAINFAIYDSPITIIHGPPGTGKTYTLIELIQQLAFNHQERVLVCGPSNISVDTILERLSSSFNQNKKKSNPEQLIRIGHPARLLANNLRHSLDILSKSGESDARKILNDIEHDISKNIAKTKKCKNYAERRALWAEVKLLRKELRTKEKKVISELITNSKVVLSTLHGAGAYELTSLYKDPTLNFNSENPLFDTIIIDEVSQSLEPQCWIPIINHLGFKRLIIAGDNMQLPPTIKSKDDKKGIAKLKLDNVADLEITLFDRLVKEHDGNKFKKLLDTQYRMNEMIMKFPSQAMYDNKLKADDSVKNINLADLDIEGDDCSELIWYDTQGGDFPERADDDSIGDTGSKYNEMEAMVLSKHLQSLLDSGVKPEHIGLISPYNAQVSLLKRKVVKEFGIEGIEISTVDGFQGREKEVIIISLVRSNDNWEVGFLRDKRRLNVAMTRPKRQLCVIGDLEMLQNSGVQFLKDWANFVEDGNDYDLRYPNFDDY